MVAMNYLSVKNINPRRHGRGTARLDRVGTPLSAHLCARPPEDRKLRPGGQPAGRFVAAWPTEGTPPPPEDKAHGPWKARIPPPERETPAACGSQQSRPPATRGPPSPGSLATGTNLGSAPPEARGAGGRCWKADIIFSLAVQQQNNAWFCVWGVGEGRANKAGSGSGPRRTCAEHSRLRLSPGSPSSAHLGHLSPQPNPCSSAAPGPSSRGPAGPTRWSRFPPSPSPPPRPPQSQACGSGLANTSIRRKVPAGSSLPGDT